MLVVEQSGNRGGAKKAKAGSSGGEIAAGTNYQVVAVADKQDGTNKQYCKIHRTKAMTSRAARRSSSLSSSKRLNTSDATR